MSGVYYNPEEHDLQIVAEIDYLGWSYEYDLRVIWRHLPTGRLLTARDAGCSCNSPFEDYCSVEDLDQLDVEALVREVREETIHGPTAEEVARFLRKARYAARARGKK